MTEIELPKFGLFLFDSDKIASGISGFGISTKHKTGSIH